MKKYILLLLCLLVGVMPFIVIATYVVITPFDWISIFIKCLFIYLGIKLYIDNIPKKDE